MGMILAVAGGGALGAVARYLFMSRIGHWLGFAFPWGTLAVNVAGSFLLGVLIEIVALKYSATREMQGFLVIGVLGGFTTFSAFSLDVVALIQNDRLAWAGAYALASVGLAVGGLWLGLRLFRLLLS